MECQGIWRPGRKDKSQTKGCKGEELRATQKLKDLKHVREKLGHVETSHIVRYSKRGKSRIVKTMTPVTTPIKIYLPFYEQ